MEWVLELAGIRKQFPGVTALDGVNLAVRGGQVLGLVGENGAGKSTLIKILSGIYRPDAGVIRVNGRPIILESPGDARALGIAVVHQDRKLIPELTVAENLWIGGPVPRNRWGMIEWGKVYSDSARALEALGIGIDPRCKISELSPAQQQLVDIAKAVLEKANLVLFDEPTTSLTQEEIRILFDIVRRLQARGVAVVYVSHRLEEVTALAQRVAVLRDGKVVADVATAQTDIPRLIRYMVGRDLSRQYPPREAKKYNEELLRVDGLYRRGAFEDISFVIHRGEIVGLGGVVGAGRTELARVLFGIDRADGGAIYVAGEPTQISSVSSAVRVGFGLVPEDRRREGLVLGSSVSFNVVLGNERRFTRGPFVDWSHASRVVNDCISSLNIRCRDSAEPVQLLSGGNQQKVVVGRWLASGSRLYILDEPTVGVDVGARLEMYTIMNRLTQQGAGILMISSDFSELVGMSDRILVMRSGRIVGELARGCTQGELLALAVGGH